MVAIGGGYGGRDVHGAGVGGGARLHVHGLGIGGLYRSEVTGAGNVNSSSLALVVVLLPDPHNSHSQIYMLAGVD